MTKMKAPCGGILLDDEDFYVVDKVIKVKPKGVGIVNHNDLQNRNASDAHDIDCITGLRQIIETIDYSDGIIYMRYESETYVQNDSNLYPYKTLALAKTAILPTRNKIIIGDSNTYTESSSFTIESPLGSINGMMAKISANIVINSSGFIYKVHEHNGDITINQPCEIIIFGNVTGNIIVNAKSKIIILGELKGNITINTTGGETYMKIGVWDDNTYNLTDETNLKNGSIIGRWTYGLVAKR